MAELTWRARLARNVFEVYLFAVCILVGAVGLAFPVARARSLVRAFPGYTQIGWYLALLLAGALCITAIAYGAELGLLVERAALLIVAGLCISFAVASAGYSGASGSTGALMLGGFGVACLVRAWQLTGDLAALRAELRARAADTTAARRCRTRR